MSRRSILTLAAIAALSTISLVPAHATTQGATNAAPVASPLSAAAQPAATPCFVPRFVRVHQARIKARRAWLKRKLAR
jgi:hypothetical protein